MRAWAGDALSLVLCRLGLDIPILSGVVDVEGGWDLEVIDGRVVYDYNIFCGRFVTGDIFLGISLCSNLLCCLLCC